MQAIQEWIFMSWPWLSWKHLITHLTTCLSPSKNPRILSVNSTWGQQKKQSIFYSSGGISTGVKVWFLLYPSCHVRQSMNSFCAFQNTKKIAAHVNQILQNSKWLEPSNLSTFYTCMLTIIHIIFNQLLHLNEMFCPAMHLQRQQILQFFTCASVKMLYLSQKLFNLHKIDQNALLKWLWQCWWLQKDWFETWYSLFCAAQQGDTG